MVLYAGEDKALDERYDTDIEAQLAANKKYIDDTNAKIQQDIGEMQQEVADIFADGDACRIELMFQPWTWELLQVLLDGKIIVDYTT